MRSPPVAPDVVELLRQAAAWRLIGLLLECPREGWNAEVQALAAEVDDAALKEAADLARQQASEGLYHTTFGPGGPAPPREVSYRDTLHPGRFLAELRGTYEAFAYAPAGDEAPDHVSVEAGFISYLRMKEAYARSRGHEEEANTAAEAAGGFVEDHLASIAEPLSAALESSGIRYFALTASALLARAGPPKQGSQSSPDSVDSSTNALVEEIG